MSLEDKAIDFKGQKYVLIKDRVLYFNKKYPEGSIVTELVSKPEDQLVIVKATVYPELTKERKFTGYSQATWGEGFINKTAALENCETSAVGRALAFMGIGVIDSIASIDEINKAQTSKPFDAELSKKKQEVYQLLLSHGVENVEEQMSLIEDALGKRSIDTLQDADKVLERLRQQWAATEKP